VWRDTNPNALRSLKHLKYFLFSVGKLSLPQRSVLSRRLTSKGKKPENASWRLQELSIIPYSIHHITRKRKKEGVTNTPQNNLLLAFPTHVANNLVFIC
jgi:hypothetical protein